MLIIIENPIIRYENIWSLYNNMIILHLTFYTFFYQLRIQGYAALNHYVHVYITNI